MKNISLSGSEGCFSYFLNYACGYGTAGCSIRSSGSTSIAEHPAGTFTPSPAIPVMVCAAINIIDRTFSATSISKYLKSENRSIDNETVYDYLSKLESAYILYRCSRYDIQEKEYLKTQEKFYLADTSLRYNVLGYTPGSIASMLENVVCLELRRRGYDVYVGKLDSTEVDFVASRQEDRLYIQVTQRISTPETEKREYEWLLAIEDNSPKYVLRTDAFAWDNYKGIKTMHVADFLLSDEY